MTAPKLSPERIEDACENARDAFGYSNACCPQDDVPMCVECGRLRALAIAVLEFADEIEALAAERDRYKEALEKIANKDCANPYREARRALGEGKT
jgi:hypothetical protein